MSPALGGCTHDVVLPDQVAPAPPMAKASCGNGVVEGDEECDTTSPGCIDCQLQPGWACTSSGCSMLCGDGGAFDDAGDDCGAATAENPCDLTGFWAVRETTYLRDQVFGTVQVSSNWYLYDVAQVGDNFAITASLDCGVHVTGSATIDYPPATLQSLIWLNSEDGTDPSRGQRQGTSTPEPGACAVTLAPWYFVRGVTTAYLPADFASDPPLDGMEPLPSVSDPINGTVFPEGATDPTTSGIPGVGTVVSGLAPGMRYSAQRSTAAFSGMSSLGGSPLTLVIQGTFNVQENVLRVTECGQTCSLLTTLAVPATDLPPHTTWQFVGKALSSAASVVVAAPRVDKNLDIQTCMNVQTLLPHDGTVPQ
jgi:hypothetical protein